MRSLRGSQSTGTTGYRLQQLRLKDGPKAHNAQHDPLVIKQRNEEQETSLSPRASLGAARHAYLCPLNVGWCGIQDGHQRTQSGCRGLAPAAGVLDVVGHHHGDGAQLVSDLVLQEGTTLLKEGA